MYLYVQVPVHMYRNACWGWRDTTNAILRNTVSSFKTGISLHRAYQLGKIDEPVSPGEFSCLPLQCGNNRHVPLFQVSSWAHKIKFIFMQQSLYHLSHLPNSSVPFLELDNIPYHGLSIMCWQTFEFSTLGSCAQMTFVMPFKREMCLYMLVIINHT